MHLSLSPEEFERLLKLAYLGEAVVNDWTPDREATEHHRAASDLLYDLCERAADTPAAALVTQDDESGEWVPSPQMQEEMGGLLKAYDNDVFWDELVTRLAHRDLVAEYGQPQIEQMPEAYWRGAESPVRDFYWKEVREHGIDRLKLEDAGGRSGRRREQRSPRKRRSQPSGDGEEK